MQDVDDPNLAKLPNFVALEFQEDFQHFLNAGLMDQQAIDALEHIWRHNNKRDRAVWARRQQESMQVAEEARQRETICQKQQEEEEAQILHKEDKKNKTKFTPILDMEVVAEPIILPSQAVLLKLQQYKFCKL
ncbi:hypothetical protein ID866_10441 [Astraeus odoratus]|nr:hypothetical protein ID866_10441 [Astraeus odoratus]